MTLPEFLDRVQRLRESAATEIDAATTLDAWTARRNHLVGRKSGQLAELMAILPTLSAEDKRSAGAALNTLKEELEAGLEAKRVALSEAAPHRPALDLSMPGRSTW